MVISQTPYRISFFGGGTDYTPYYSEHGGSVISTTIDKYCYINLRRLPPFFDHSIRIAYSVLENVREFDEIKHPSVRECLRYHNINNVSVTYDGDLPARAGLGTSSAFTVGLLNAIYSLKGERIDKLSLGKEAIKIERDIIKENVGVQDQLAVAVGGFNKMNFENNNLTVEPIGFDETRKNSLNENLMLFYTGISRIASDIAKEQMKNTHKIIAELKEMHSMVAQGEKILLGNGNLDDFGSLLNESWAIKRSLTNKISNATIDDIYATALKHGALGGKLLGAGGGGFIIFYVPKVFQKKVKEAVKLLHIPFKFEDKGSKIIYCNNVE